MGYNFRRGQVLLQHIRCPECGVAMAERQGATGPFYGCARFPICIGSRPKGDGVDSYSKLLHAAYVKATRFLGAPKFIGAEAKAWLLDKAFDREPTEDELESNQVVDMANEHLERAIDAACAYATEITGNEVDFLLFAHDERYESMRGRLKYLTSAEQIRAMPRPEIIRRYDTSDMQQFEADISPEWKAEGAACPRCGAWSESKHEDVLLVGSEAANLDELDLKPKDLASLFGTLGDAEDEVIATRRKWDCGRCGVFTRVESKKGKEVSLHFEYENDKKEGSVVGASFKLHDRRKKE